MGLGCLRLGSHLEISDFKRLGLVLELHLGVRIITSNLLCRVDKFQLRDFMGWHHGSTFDAVDSAPEIRNAWRCLSNCSGRRRPRRRFHCACVSSPVGTFSSDYSASSSVCYCVGFSGLSEDREFT